MKQSTFDGLRAVRDQIMLTAAGNTDMQDLAVKEIYSLWNQLADGTTLTSQAEAVSGTEITKVRDGNKLYKVIQTHKKQADRRPGPGMESLFAVINETETGTQENPIPYEINMIVYAGKYYTYGGILYRCNRDSGTALQHTPDQLIGHYFETI